MVQSLRASLEDERTRLRAQLLGQAPGDVGAADFDENFADSGQVAAEQGEQRALVNQLTDALADVDRALAKMDDGTYGTCEVCGKEIAEARLEAMPATRWCIDHASGR